MRKRNRGGALLLVLLLTLGGAWPAYAAEPETPPPAATEESGLPAPEPEEPPQPAPMISAVVTGFAGDGLPALPAVTLPVRQTGNSDDDLEPLYRLAVQQQSVTALVTAGEESRQEPLGVAWDFGDIDQTKTGTYQAVGRIELPEGYVLAEGVPGALYIPVTVEDQSPEVITAVESWYPYTDAFALPLGSDLEVLEEKFCFSPYTLQCETESGKTVTAAIEWDFSRGIPDRGGLSGGGHGAPAGKHGLWGWACSAPDHRSRLRPAAGQAGTQLPSGRTGGTGLSLGGPTR